MRIAFFASNLAAFHGDSLEERLLGAAETNVIRLSDALASLGHEVIVFTPCETPTGTNPRYLPLRAIEQHPSIDVFVSIRDWIPLLHRLPFRKRVLWTDETGAEFSNFGLGDKRVAAQVDCLLATTRTQAESLCKMSGFPAHKVDVLGFGVEAFAGTEDRRRKRLIYVAPPAGPLAYIPSLYMELKKQHPDLEIYLLNSQEPKDLAHAQLERVLTSLPASVLIRNVLSSQIARELMRASIFFYPALDDTISLPVVLDAQAAGCVILSSKTSALSEVIGDAGVLIDGRPTDPAYAQQYLAAAHELLSNDELWARLSNLSRERVGSRTWRHLAERFERLVQIDGSVF